MMGKIWILIFGILLINSAVIRGDDGEEVEEFEEESDEEVLYEEVDEEVEGDADEEADTEDVDDASEVETDNGVLVLTDDNFDDVVYNKEIILVEFYAPWCGHCKSLAPEYEKAAQTLSEGDTGVVLAKVDATIHKEAAQRFDVNGYPTLKFFKNGQANDYEGPRQAAGIVSYMTERASPDWAPPPPAVVVLGNDNFTEFTNAHDLSLVEFFAPWCGHCKQLAPEYEKAAQELKNDVPMIPLATVDATQETDLAKEFDVSGYPTLKLFRRGKVYEYKGGRDKMGIVQYLRNQVGDASVETKSLKSLKSQMSKEDVTVVGFFKSSEDKEYEIYQEAASDLREDYTFLHSFDPETRDHYKSNPNSVVVFNAEKFYTKFESKWHTFSVKEDTEMTEITEFIAAHNVPLVGLYDQTSREKRYKERRPLVLVFFTVDFSFDHVKATQLWRNKVADIAKDKKYKELTFAIADDDKMADEFKAFGFDDSGEEMNIGIFGEKDRKYPMEPMEEFESDDIREFLDKFLKGKVTPLVKSQPVPKKQKGPVTVLVGKSFDKVVTDSKKDVLIEFYAPGCGHCKKLEPIYKELAKKYKKEDNLVIAKMDSTANDAPSEYEVQGFPTIYFSKATNRAQPIKFEGAGRELDDFVSFIEEHASVSLGKSPKEEL